MQRSAYPDRYDKREPQAKQLLLEAQHDANTPPPGDDPQDQAAASEARFKHTLKYIYGEMIRNQNDPVTWAISLLYRISPSGMDSIPHVEPPSLDASHLAAKVFNGADWVKWLELAQDGIQRTPSLALFAVKVAPGMDWDHKPKIEQRLHLDPHNDDQHFFRIPADEHNREAYYDIWSNMHYGLRWPCSRHRGRDAAQGP